jgi:hypothetical protein
MTTIGRHVDNGYISVSHFVCVKCELTPEKIGAWSRVPDSVQNERASPPRVHDLVGFDVPRVPAIARGAILALCPPLCPGKTVHIWTRSVKDPAWASSENNTSYPCDLQTLADLAPGEPIMFPNMMPMERAGLKF